MAVVDLEAVVVDPHLDIRCRRQVEYHTLKKGMICKTYKTMSILTLNIHILYIYLASVC